MKVTRNKLLHYSILFLEKEIKEIKATILKQTDEDIKELLETRLKELENDYQSIIIENEGI